MPNFSYQARDSNGQLVSGSLEAADERAAASSLSRLGYQPVRIERLGALQELSQWITSHRDRVNRQELLTLLRTLATLLRSGIPLASCLEGAIPQMQSMALRQILSDIMQQVKGGSSLSDAMANHPSVFPEFFVSMVRVGEVAGILDQVLERLAQLGTQELETRSRVSSALIYPMVLVLFAFLVVSGLLLGVLPKFIAVFEASQAKLPMPTRILLFISGTLRRFWWLVALGVGGAVLWLRSYYASMNGRSVIDRWILRLPLVGHLIQKILIARMARTLGAMLQTGVPLLEALAVVEKTVPNMVYQKVLQQARLAVTGGQSLAEALAAGGLLPPLVIQMVAVGERSGQVDVMLKEVAAFYDPEIELTIRNLTSILEPVLLLGMGLVVGFVALSVLLPIFQLIHVFRR